MISAVIITLLIYRGAQENTGVFPYENDGAWPFASWVVGKWLHPLGYGVNSVLEVVFILAQLGVIMAFLVVVFYSKHLHIFLAGLNVLFSRRPDALGPLEPMRSGGKVLDFEEADPDTDTFGIGKVEDLTWKGMLDLGTCTECGRCQSQCPAWVTGKPLSPKQLILDLRDHAFAKAPYLLAAGGRARVSLSDLIKAEAERPLVGADDGERGDRPGGHLGVHELRGVRERVPGRHRAHRPHQRDAPPPGPDRVRLPDRGDHDAEQPGAPRQPVGDGRGQARWSGSPSWTSRFPCWTAKIPADVEYLYWVGCAGALEDRAKKATKAIAELLDVAGVKFAVLGPAEACTGDPARRLGNEFVFSMLAQQNIETLNEAGVAKGTGKKVIASCPHCFNTISREYPQLGGNYEVIHHTQLLARLVEDGKLTPVTPVEEKITYHDPCFLGRHNKVYTPAARDHRRRPRHHRRGNAPLQGQGLLLRRRRRPHVARGADRQADQRGAHRRGPRPRPRHRLHRLPLLHGHARRRRQRQESHRRGQADPRGHRRRPAPRPLRQAPRGSGRGNWARRGTGA